MSLSANQQPSKAMPRWLPPVLFAGALLAVAVLSNHSKETTTPEGLDIVADDSAYARTLAKAGSLSAQALQKYQDGEQLTPAEIANVRAAAKLIDEANLYKPNQVAPFFLTGKAHAALQDYVFAIKSFRQGIANVGNNHSDAMFQAVVNAHYEVSRALYALGEFNEAYNEASAAAAAIPTSPEYLVARAKAAMQVNKNDVAKEEISAALAIDPTYAPAKVLGKYLHVSPPTKAGM